MTIPSQAKTISRVISQNESLCTFSPRKWVELHFVLFLFHMQTINLLR